MKYISEEQVKQISSLIHEREGRYSDQVDSIILKEIEKFLGIREGNSILTNDQTPKFIDVNRFDEICMHALKINDQIYDEWTDADIVEAIRKELNYTKVLKNY